MEQAIISSLPLVATSLVNLSLHGVIPGLASILPSFASLSHLTIHLHCNYFESYGEFLNDIRTVSIKCITVHVVYEHLLWQIPNFKKSLINLLSQAGDQVTKLVINPTEENGVEGMEKIMELCQLYGITVRYEGPLSRFGTSSFRFL